MSLMDFFKVEPSAPSETASTEHPRLPQRDSDGNYLITISAASARLLFQGCDPEYIRSTCHGRCCETSAPQGTLIVIHKSEADAIRARGGIINDGILKVPDGQRTCMFKHTEGADVGLCKLHPEGIKPWACTASPWHFSSGFKLIIRNRYKMLICYKAAPALPAYKAFNSGLRAIFGTAQAAQIVEHFERGGDDITVPMHADVFNRLHERDELWVSNRSKLPRGKTLTAPPLRQVPLDEALTPVQEAEGILFKRDDLCEPAPGARGGKARTLHALAQGASAIVTCGGRGSRQAKIAACVGKQLGIPVRVHTATGKDTPEILAAQAEGAEIIRHKPGYTSVLAARAHDDAATIPGAVEIPYAMGTAEQVRQTAAQVASIVPYAARIKRIVVPCGSGMSLSGILTGLRQHGLNIPVLGIIVGASPLKQLRLYAPADYEQQLTLKESGIDYHKPISACIGGIVLDPIYEGKCAAYLTAGDMLWMIG